MAFSMIHFIHSNVMRHTTTDCFKIHTKDSQRRKAISLHQMWQKLRKLWKLWNALSHFMQSKSFSPLWILVCILKQSVIECLFTFPAGKWTFQYDTCHASICDKGIQPQIALKYTQGFTKEKIHFPASNVAKGLKALTPGFKRNPDLKKMPWPIFLLNPGSTVIVKSAIA